MPRHHHIQCRAPTPESRNGDTLGPEELILWPEEGDLGDRRKQDDEGEVSIIIFGMSESSGFQKYIVFVVVFVIVFQNMYSYRGLWSPQAEILTIFEVMTDIINQSVGPIPLIDW